MPRPLHLVGLIVAVALTAGCHDREPKRSVYAPGEAHDILASSGERALLVDDDGDTVAKLRVSKDEWEVFDAERRFVGVVELRESGIRAKKGRTGEWMRMTRDDYAWEMPGHARAEIMRDGWAVFDAKNELVGFFSADDAGWVQRATVSGDVVRSATKDGVVKADAAIVLKTTTGDVPPAILLALSNEGLGPLGAVAVGALMNSSIGDERRQALETAYRRSVEGRAAGESGQPDAGGANSDAGAAD